VLSYTALQKENDMRAEGIQIITGERQSTISVKCHEYSMFP